MLQNVHLFCNVLIHRGEILEKIVRKWCDENGMPLKDVAEKIGYHRNIVYRHFSDPKVSYSIIYKYGKAIGYDFAENFPEMNREIFNIEKRIDIDTKSFNSEQCEKEIEHWRGKYIALLEHYNEVILKKILT